MRLNVVNRTSFLIATSIVLALSMFVQSMMLPSLLEVRINNIVILILSCVMMLLVMVLGQFTYNSTCKLMIMTTFMLVFGFHGLLIGVWFDFGVFGLLTFTSICSALEGFGWSTFVTKLIVAPWSFLGMFLASNLGMFLSKVYFQNEISDSRDSLLFYVVLNVGMVLGMWMVEGFSFTISEINPAYRVLFFCSSMLLGMTTGMLLSWYLLQELKHWLVNAVGQVTAR